MHICIDTIVSDLNIYIAVENDTTSNIGNIVQNTLMNII